ncbi:MAG TPA: glucuronate isomerase [Planctomycetota bacterium]|nr:glucuronate isomerase [Planctomycetota bacterium]
MSDIFITENFLLQSNAAVELYHEHAKNCAIIDYHCHLPPLEIAVDHRFANLTQIWLAGDHYKWRAMRADGINERYITGAASDWEKFQKWAEVVPHTLRNPLYHWTHLELKRPFGISDRLLNPETAAGIWEECNAKLARPEFSCRGIMKQMNVVLVCTTDDPADSLEHHRAIVADTSFGIKVLPAFRPDKGMAVENPSAFNAWVDKLAAASDVDIVDFKSYMDALRERHDYFHACGGRLSDHGVETIFAEDCTESEARAIFAKVRGGAQLDGAEILKFKSAMLYEFGIMDHARNWTQQYHIGALRGANSRLLKALGPDTGFDSIGDWPIAQPMAKFFNRLDSENKLARTIIYNNNPRDNAVYAAMIGNFQDGSFAGKMQFGSSWWHLDQLDGMTRQIEDLSNMGLLSRFVGMLTDSRSFLSYTRHEYFRRMLCNILGGEIERGLLPRDMKLIGGTVRDICYNNAAKYFGFEQ